LEGTQGGLQGYSEEEGVDIVERESGRYFSLNDRYKSNLLHLFTSTPAEYIHQQFHC
jgi:hypothetical protein